MKADNRFGLQAGMFTTFMLGATFLFVQINEYVHVGFSPQDNAQGTIFYGLTGLHGAHVFIGLTLLAIVMMRAFRGHFSAASTAASRCRGSTGTSSTSCGSSSTRPSTSSDDINPLRSEREAFRFLLYVIASLAVVIALVLLARAVLVAQLACAASLDPGVDPRGCLAEGLYLRAVRSCAGAAWRCPRPDASGTRASRCRRSACFSPIDALGDDLLSAHMAQHLLIADLAAPLLLVGLRNPVLVFFLPRAVLVRAGALGAAARGRSAAAAAAGRRPAVRARAVRLALLVRCSRRRCATRSSMRCSTRPSWRSAMLVWWSALEPQRRRLPGELWKIPLHRRRADAGMMLGMSFVLIRVAGLHRRLRQRATAGTGSARSATSSWPAG